MKSKDFTHSTRVVPMKNGKFDLQKAVKELLDQGLLANATSVTIFVNFDGVHFLAGETPWVRVAGKSYPLVVEQTSEIHKTGDVRLKYNA